jgi:ABC-2 type transport system ATP-binding protein
MLKAENLTKKFEEKTALSCVSVGAKGGGVYGLVGTNGAGKSTLLRLLAGVYKGDSGSVTLDGKPVFENPEVKKSLVFVPDELFFLPQANLKRMAGLYASAYKSFEKARFYELCRVFGLDAEKRVNSFSKGLKRQAALALALSCRTEYALFDETFDGLDPVMRNLARRLIYADVCERGLGAVITSHSLRELEDTCDTLALLHQGSIVLEKNVEDLKSTFFKVQAAFNFDYDEGFFKDIAISRFKKTGSVCNFILRGGREEAEKRIRESSPVLFEMIPLTLEEIFMVEMADLGYAPEESLI